jgi:hypothetical protein
MICLPFGFKNFSDFIPFDHLRQLDFTVLQAEVASANVLIL